MTVTDAAKDYVNKLFAGNAGGHDYAHTMRVYANAMLLADTEKECDRTIVALAALLHDVDDHKLFTTEENQHARAFLDAQGLNAETTEQILHVIRGVSFSQNRGKHSDTLEGMIVQDADRLDAMGAIGIARTFAYGGEHGRPMEESLQHFHEKLLMLRDGMNTQTGRCLAERRHAFMLAFLEELQQETSVWQGEEIHA